MRYWELDICKLIQDEKQINRTLATIQRQIELAERMIEDPLEGRRGEWIAFLKILKLREAEFACYSDMIRNGLQDLPEVERMVLEMWLQDKCDDDYIVEHCCIKNRTELNKIRKIALAKFCKIAMPD